MFSLINKFCCFITYKSVRRAWATCGQITIKLGSLLERIKLKAIIEQKCQSEENGEEMKNAKKKTSNFYYHKFLFLQF